MNGRVNAMRTQGGRNLGTLRRLLSERVAAHGDAVDNLLKYDNPLITDSLDALSMSWFRKGMRLQEDPKKGFSLPRNGRTGDSRFDSYTERFLALYDTFDAPKAAAHLGYSDEDELVSGRSRTIGVQNHRIDPRGCD